MVENMVWKGEIFMKIPEIIRTPEDIRKSIESGIMDVIENTNMEKDNSAYKQQILQKAMGML